MSKPKTLHCRLTEEQHDAVHKAALDRGIWVTDLVVRALDAYGVKMPTARVSKNRTSGGAE